MRGNREIKKKKIKMRGNMSFAIMKRSLIVSFVFSVLMSVVDKHWEIIPWPNEYEDVIGASLQIATAIVSLVVSIIGIAISLQNEECFGIKMTKLYSLRVTKHYSILEIIVGAVILSFVQMAAYMIDLTLASIVILGLSLIFLLQVVIMEIPIMAKEEKALLHILKNNLVNCYLHKKEASLDLKESIKYLLYKKNFAELYQCLKDEDDVEYNKYVVMKLIELQRDMSAGLLDKSVEEQRVIGSSLVTNVVDIMLQHTNISDAIYDDIVNSPFLLTSILYKVNAACKETNPLLRRIQGLIQCISFSSKESRKVDNLISSVLIVLTVETVKRGDFRIIKSIRRELSNMAWGLEKDTPMLTVFAVISLHLYYLCCSEPECPEELKKRIVEFINEDGIIEEQTKISSWKNLFAKSTKKFNLNYQDFLRLVIKHEDDLEYWLYGMESKFVVLSPSFVARWYLTYFINASRYSKAEFQIFFDSCKEIHPYLKDLGDACFDKKRNFSPTEEMKRIARFYSDDKEHFRIFRVIENRDHILFDYINQIRIEELEKERNLVEQIDLQPLANSIRQNLNKELIEEWGFDSKLEIANQERAFTILFEKCADISSLEEIYSHIVIRNVFADIEKTIKKTIVKNEKCVDKSVQEWLSKGIKYISLGAKSTIPFLYLHDNVVKDKFVKDSESWIEIESRFLDSMALVTEFGFSFNCSVKDVSFRALSEEELSKLVTKYQREDGQYVFDGAFMPKEEIAALIRDKFAILRVAICHQVVSAEEDILELNPYFSEDS